MISVNLATPVIFYKQLPGIAKKLDVDADFLKGFSPTPGVMSRMPEKVKCLSWTTRPTR